jgi:hypothetical protein
VLRGCALFRARSSKQIRVMDTPRRERSTGSPTVHPTARSVNERVRTRSPQAPRPTLTLTPGRAGDRGRGGRPHAALADRREQRAGLEQRPSRQHDSPSVRIDYSAADSPRKSSSTARALCAPAGALLGHGGDVLDALPSAWVICANHHCSYSMNGGVSGASLRGARYRVGRIGGPRPAGSTRACVLSHCGRPRPAGQRGSHRRPVREPAKSRC